jgi:hypothetical protein
MSQTKQIIPVGERKALINNCPKNFIAEAFCVSTATIANWTNEGCPRNVDGSFCLTDVINWRIKRETDKAESPGSLKDIKTEQEIELLKARIDKERQSNIPRSLHETILISRMGTLRSFLEKTFMSNAVYLAGKTVDEVRTSLYKLVQSAMQAYAGNAEDE